MENIKVTSQRCKIFIVLILLFICHSTYAASSKPASVLLQEGLYAEEVEGNLDEAIKIYQEVITASQQIEQSAAQATYRIGLCYLKKGNTEQASKQFSELVTKYPKQESLVNEAQKQLDKLKPAVTLGFTPAIDLEIPIYDENDNGIEKCFLDFETAKLFSIPENSSIRGNEDEIKKWCRQNNLDTYAILDRYKIILSEDWYGGDTFANISKDSWNFLQSENINDFFGQDVSLGHTYYDRLPAYFAFKTLEGNCGLLQILSTTDKTINIRYKMVVQEREVFIPDWDTKNVGVILDLATGDLLKASTELRELDKGDFGYDDKYLLCLRGAKAYRIISNFQDENLVELSIFDQTEDMTGYELEARNIPGRYQINTAEGDNYELNIISADSSGLNIKYAKTIMQPKVAKTDSTNYSGETGDPEAAAKMIAPLYGMFSSAYESLMSNNDPNTAQAIIEMAMPQLDIFENLMKGTDSYQSISMGIQVMREINEALKKGEIDKAKGLLNVINTSGDQLEMMVKEEASKAQNASKATNSNSIELEHPLPPVVINTEPKNYSNNVSPDTTEISVTFDREMMDRSWSWVRWNYPFPEGSGDASYDNTKTTCTVSVKMEPGKAYLVRINSDKHTNFKSADGTIAKPYVLVFSTLDENGKPTPIPEEMLNFAKQVNSEITAISERPFVYKYYGEITPDGLIKFKSIKTITMQDDSDPTTFSFTTVNKINITGIYDGKGKPLKFTVTSQMDGLFLDYDVTLNEPVERGEKYSFSTEGTAKDMIERVDKMKNTFMHRIAYYDTDDGLMATTFLLPKSAELISTTPADMKRTESNGRIELYNEKPVGQGKSISTQFQYKLEK